MLKTGTHLTKVFVEEYPIIETRISQAHLTVLGTDQVIVKGGG